MLLLVRYYMVLLKLICSQCNVLITACCHKSGEVVSEEQCRKLCVAFALAKRMCGVVVQYTGSKLKL